MKANTKSVSPLANILVIILIITVVAVAGYFVYTQVADSAAGQNENQSASDLDIVLEDLNITFDEARYESRINTLKSKLQAIDNLEAIELQI
jgi:NADH:ubiquinone oxidoreductase subunit 3 (subunit A)